MASQMTVLCKSGRTGSLFSLSVEHNILSIFFIFPGLALLLAVKLPNDAQDDEIIRY